MRLSIVIINFKTPDLVIRCLGAPCLKTLCPAHTKYTTGMTLLRRTCKNLNEPVKLNF